jgi:AraC-like DNA-binding protein
VNKVAKKYKTEQLKGYVAIILKYIVFFPSRFKNSCLSVYQNGVIEAAGGVSVTEVSELCGFSDIYYFSKTFKKLCGTLPSRWK